MIIDTGPLVLLLTEKQRDEYAICYDTFDLFRGKLVTTYPCLTEAMYLLDDWRYQALLWDWILEGSVTCYDLTSNDLDRMSDLMKQYQDTPMDFADASLVALAETCGSKQIFTLDSDFSIYRLSDKTSFELIP